MIASIAAAIVAFFAVGTWGFFGFLLLLSVLYTIAVERDTHGFAVFATIVGLVLLWNPIRNFTHDLNWIWLIGGLISYGFFGGLWASFRWSKFCTKQIAQNPYSGASKHVKEDTSEEEYYTSLCVVNEHKSQLISWIIYWPWSLVWNVTGDFFTGIYDAFTGVFKSIARTAVKRAIAASD